MRWSVVFAAAALCPPALAFAQESDAELAHKLNNPVADLISVPLQLNHDCCFGPDDGARATLNVQPVFPVALNDDWKVIVRTIVPVVYQDSPAPGVGDAFGLSDTTQSFFFSPTPKGGLTWAIGPAFLWPTGTEGLGTRQWGAGPTALVLKQQGKDTFGLLANHIWSYAGPEPAEDVSSTFIQPFWSHTTATATTFGLNSEASYDWVRGDWTVPINATVSHLYSFGRQRVSLGVGARVYAVSPDDGAEWGLRAVATFLFPK